MAGATPDFTQGRIRLNRQGAEEVREALDAHLGFLLDARGTVQDVPEARTKLNARIAYVRRVIAELERTSQERGWTTDGQLFGTQP